MDPWNPVAEIEDLLSAVNEVNGNHHSGNSTGPQEIGNVSTGDMVSQSARNVSLAPDNGESMNIHSSSFGQLPSSDRPYGNSFSRSQGGNQGRLFQEYIAS